MLIENFQVKQAGYYYIGHFSRGELRIDFGNFFIRIPINNDNEYKIFELLYKIFDIDSEDGLYLEAIKGKYCRALIDNNLKIIALQHIVNSNKFELSEFKR